MANQLKPNIFSVTLSLSVALFLSVTALLSVFEEACAELCLENTKVDLTSKGAVVKMSRDLCCKVAVATIITHNWTMSGEDWWGFEVSALVFLI